MSHGRIGTFRAPALGPLWGAVNVGQDDEQLRLNVGFSPSWGPPQAMVLSAVIQHDGVPHTEVIHVLPWLDGELAADTGPDGSPCCVQAFEMKPTYWREHTHLTCLLAYGFESLVDIKRARLPWPHRTPPSCVLSWPQPWDNDSRGGTPGGTCFVVSSCQYPAGLLDAAPDAQDWAPGPADASFARLLRWREQSDAVQPAFAMLLGDQVYIDATAGLFDPQALGDRYIKPYLAQMQRHYRNEALRNLPLLGLPDDHEIHNDWQPAPHTRIGPARQQALEAGLTQYWHFQRMQAPQPVVWQTFHRHGASFFMADTRTERSARTAATIASARIMGDTQHRALMHWIEHEGPQGHPKFLACPSAVLPRRASTDTRRPASGLHSDAWDGYPQSLYQLLGALCDHEVRNMVLLSGDEHLSSLARITLQRLEHAEQAPTATSYPVVRLASVHSSGWYSPFPFANSQPHDLRGQEVFEFSVGETHSLRRHYRCTVETTFFPGDGCALIHTQRAGRVRCRFLKGQAHLEPADWLDVT